MTEANEFLYCIGCGAKIQTEDKQKRGYTPQSAYQKGIETGELYCQRCFKLRHYNQLEKVSTTEDEFLAILNTLSDKDALIVNVIDLFDISGSLIHGLNRFVGNNKLLMLGNKRDILPKALNDQRVSNWARGQLKQLGIHVDDFMLVSAEKRHYVDDVLAKIEAMRDGKDVYIIGVTNVGKSTLVNRILQSTGLDTNLITTSRFPGTTLDIIEIPFDDNSSLIDTPGIIHNDQMTSLLSLDELKQVMPQSELWPRTYQLNPQQTLFVGGLTQFDFVSGERMSVTAYFSQRLNIHRRKLAGADEFYLKHAGELLTPAIPQDTAKFVAKTIKIKQPTDVVISGLGWFNVSIASEVTIHVPEGISVYLRDPMI
ncbi:ribosome biogenesis GTPase YqeH [Aerococcus suis]|uniref:Uncharacterized protein n=1 Tax=Aerococcus suis TaxID=371602 RepID=A0A1W1YK75_9LACT|nr:ribosome biogenesis GTPase YqeH [Aerococcus suis]SMC36640.1 hypothetical protein SAMN04487984_0755 [Aerococcus suis]